MEKLQRDLEVGFFCFLWCAQEGFINIANREILQAGYEDFFDILFRVKN
jgi:hypothetical protein